MIYSMTGYASVEAPVGNSLYRIHMKSVNHRYFELKWRAPRAWTQFEVEARGTFQEKLSRGAVECWIELSDRSGPEAKKFPGVQNLFQRLHIALEASKEGSPIRVPAFVRALVLARFPDLWWEAQAEGFLPPEDVKSILKCCADEMLQARGKEGERIKQLLTESMRQMSSCLDIVNAALPHLQRHQREEFRQRIVALAEEMKVSQPQEQRLMQEYLFLAEKRDVAEELGRIKIHLSAFSELLNSAPSQAGKRIEFLIQELHREWTTLGTKIHDPKLIQTIIDAKLELDRIREHAANVA